jgi:hypothetical protein
MIHVSFSGITIYFPKKQILVFSLYDAISSFLTNPSTKIRDSQTTVPAKCLAPFETLFKKKEKAQAISV